MKHAVLSSTGEDLWTVVLDSPGTTKHPSERPAAERGADAVSSVAADRLTRADVLKAVHRLVPEERLLDLCHHERFPPRRSRTPGTAFVHTTHTGSPVDVLLANTYVSVHGGTGRGASPAVLFLPAGLPWHTTEELLNELNLLVRLAHRFDQVMLLGTTRPVPSVDAFPLQLELRRPASGAYVPGRAARVLEAEPAADQAGGSGEEPDRPASGAVPDVVWSTGCFAAPSSELWRLGHQCMPELTARCRELRLVLRAQAERRIPRDVEERVLQRIARVDHGGCFLRDLARHCPTSIRVLPALPTRPEAS